MSLIRKMLDYFGSEELRSTRDEVRRLRSRIESDADNQNLLEVNSRLVLRICDAERSLPGEGELEDRIDAIKTELRESRERIEEVGLEIRELEAVEAVLIAADEDYGHTDITPAEVVQRIIEERDRLREQARTDLVRLMN